MSYVIDDTYNIGSNGSTAIAKPLYIILHETGNANNTGSDSAKNEAAYMSTHWDDAYTSYIVGWNKVYSIKKAGFVSWGALSANPYAPVQIELSRYADKTLALKAYQNYVNLARESALFYGIPLALDAGMVGTKGLKSHKWVTDNYRVGDHTDPYGYLNTIGITREQFETDLKNGFSSDKGDEIYMKQVYRPTDFEGVCQVLTDGATVYQTASVTSKKIGVLKKGSTYRINGRQNNMLLIGGWVKCSDVATRELDNTLVNCVVRCNSAVWSVSAKGVAVKKLKAGSEWLVTGQKGDLLQIGRDEFIKKGAVYVCL